MKRRAFVRAGLGAGCLVGAVGMPLVARAAASYNVIVVGGGMSGASVAKYLRLWSGGRLSVALIEASPSYISNIMSNEVLTGKRASINTLVYPYTKLASSHGVQVIQGTVTAVDTVNRAVTCQTAHGAQWLSCDRLVLAPGLDFDLMPGMGSAAEYDTLAPHAWKAGAQTTLLREQLKAMPNGQPVVISIPLAPYRCPPGPYERACVVADWLRVNKPASKLILLDANAGIQAQAVNFQNAFNGAYGYTVDYRPGSTITQVQLAPGAHRIAYTQNGIAALLDAGVYNPIPPMRAPALLSQSGLLSGRFAPVNLLTYESTLASGVHVIGDACISGMPKAGHIGNQEGKTCANAIVHALLGNAYALEETSPVLNSACYTPVTSSKATWLSAVYQYSNGVMLSSTQNNSTQPRTATTASTRNYRDMERWFSTLMADTFA
ncbi:MAG: hypothetical protein RIQ97_2240 [Pseudomonadota bacterium]